jgi:hypothetical protein
MCRNIKTLFNYEPPASHEEIREAAIQFVRKIAGTNKPSKANDAAFQHAVADIEASVAKLLQALVTSAAPKDRDTELGKARAKATTRFGRAT